MPKISASAAATKWATRTQAAQQDYVDGVQSTTKDPTALAIAAGQRYIARVQEAFNSGKWANGLRRVGQAGWKQATVDKAAAFSSGVAASEGKVSTAFQSLFAYEDNLESAIATMPNVTAADRKARMNRWFDGMSAYQPPA
jgi:hypothetical protein